MAKLFVISGPSGAGLREIVGAVLDARHDIGSATPVTARKMKAGERDGVGIHFYDLAAFDDGAAKLTKIEIICKEQRFEALKNAMMAIGITGMTVSHVLGCGAQKGQPEYYRGVAVEANLLPKIQVDIVVSEVPVRRVIETAKRVLYTGHIGDGKIFVYDVENAVKVRTAPVLSYH